MYVLQIFNVVYLMEHTGLGNSNKRWSIPVGWGEGRFQQIMELTGLGKSKLEHSGWRKSNKWWNILAGEIKQMMENTGWRKSNKQMTIKNLSVIQRLKHYTDESLRAQISMCVFIIKFVRLHFVFFLKLILWNRQTFGMKLHTLLFNSS